MHRVVFAIECSREPSQPQRSCRGAGRQSFHDKDPNAVDPAGACKRRGTPILEDVAFADGRSHAHDKYVARSPSLSGIAQRRADEIPRFLIYGVAEADARAIKRIVADAEVRLRRYPHPSPERVTVVFSSQARHRTFNPLGCKTYAATDSARQIWFNEVDFRRDTFNFSSSDSTDRTIDGVLAHEVTHVALRQNYGQSILWTVPRWIREGYCETVARETSISFQSGSAQVRQASSDSSSRYFYFKSYIAVRGLYDGSDVPLDMLMTSPRIHQMQLDDLASSYISDVADSNSRAY
jgi:hypothetical protein